MTVLICAIFSLNSQSQDVELLFHFPALESCWGPLSSKLSTHKPVKTRFWSGRCSPAESGRRPLPLRTPPCVCVIAHYSVLLRCMRICLMISQSTRPDHPLSLITSPAIAWSACELSLESGRLPLPLRTPPCGNSLIRKHTPLGPYRRLCLGS